MVNQNKYQILDTWILGWHKIHKKLVIKCDNWNQFEKSIDTFCKRKEYKKEDILALTVRELNYIVENGTYMGFLRITRKNYPCTETK